MTDPTRAEVDRYALWIGEGGGYHSKEPDGSFVRYDDYAALRERAEAAERAHLSLCEAIGIPATALSHIEYATQLTAARRTEGAAWEAGRDAALSAYLKGCIHIQGGLDSRGFGITNTTLRWVVEPYACNAIRDLERPRHMITTYSGKQEAKEGA